MFPDDPDPPPQRAFDSVCTFPNATSQQSQDVRYVSVVLDRQQGTVDYQGIAGRLATAIRRGPREINGECSFTAPGR